jgi:ketosteroid isomerase-like protein
MQALNRVALVAAGLLVLAGCAKPVSAPDTAADETAIRAVNPEWFIAHQAGDADRLAGLYAEDAVLNAPGAPPVRGRTAIREAFAAEVAAMQAAGLKNNQGPSPEFGVSGDLGWEWNSFTVTDQAGATVDTGKYVTVYARRDGKWLIVRDIWNSDMPPAAPAPEAPATTPEVGAATTG